MTIHLQIADTDAVALVDDDFAHLKRYRWRLSRKGTVFRHGDFVIQLHRVILGSLPLPGFVVAWKNENRLDCRKRNLYYVTLSAKALLNAPKRPNRSCGMRGVYFNQGKWGAQATIEGKRFNLGSYATPEEASAVAVAFRTKHMRSITVQRAVAPKKNTSPILPKAWPDCAQAELDLLTKPVTNPPRMRA